MVKNKIFGFMIGMILLLLTTTIASATWSSSLNDGLVSYWTFNESSGNVIDIISGKFNMTERGSVGSVNGKIGNGRGITSGSNSFSIDLGKAIPTNTMSYTYWINETAFLSYSTYFEEFAGQTLSAPYGITLQGSADGSNRYTFRGKNDSGTLVLNEEGMYGNERTEGTFHFYAIVVNSTDAIVYLDGVVIINQTLVSPFNNLNTTAYIGAETPIGDGKYGRFIIDEAGLWNRTLSASEISSLYNGGAGITFGVITTPIPNAQYHLVQCKEGQDICNTLNSAGSGMAILFQTLGLSLPLLLIGLGAVGVIVAIAFAISNSIKNSLK